RTGQPPSSDSSSNVASRSARRRARRSSRSPCSPELAEEDVLAPSPLELLPPPPAPLPPAEAPGVVEASAVLPCPVGSPPAPEALPVGTVSLSLAHAEASAPQRPRIAARERRPKTEVVSCIIGLRGGSRTDVQPAAGGRRTREATGRSPCAAGAAS